MNYDFLHFLLSMACIAFLILSAVWNVTAKDLQAERDKLTTELIEVTLKLEHKTKLAEKYQKLLDRKKHGCTGCK